MWSAACVELEFFIILCHEAHGYDVRCQIVNRVLGKQE